MSPHLSGEPRQRQFPAYCCLTAFSLFYPLSLGFRPGGDEQIRTVDPLLARQVLSQLSYTPTFTYRGCSSLTLKVQNLQN